ncbi:MAG: DUF2971 domain-containing protein [Bacteroidetes bacterium]|nr:DUF2971 domain-containing protein [Bacteroidota bacterium]MBS1670900.1 DUF2971 domain-containing protein [Bacteroidota bacterium]
MKRRLAQLISQYLTRIFNVRYSSFTEVNQFENVRTLTVEAIEANLSESRVSADNLSSFTLTEEFEDLFFRTLFEEKPDQEFFYYTSLNSILSILDYKSLQLTSIAGMNDKTEVSFADDLLGRTFKDPYNFTRITTFNRRYIMCFTDKKDHFNQWRLYGGDGNGVCVGFKYKKPKKHDYYVVFGKVIYGDEILKLITDLINDVKRNLRCNFSLRRLHLWKNFLKHKDYEYEAETRLLIYNRTKNGYKELDKKFKLNFYNILVPYVTLDLFDDNLPIKITEITLGPKCPESSLNNAQLKYFLKEKTAKDNSYKGIKVGLSKIKHYR